MVHVNKVQMHVKQSTEIKVVPLSRIHVLNPRSRNQRIFAQLVESISTVGLKRPISITESGEDSIGTLYELICGQGRLEAFQTLGINEIPCIVIDAEEEDRYLISLVENLARRKHSNKELLYAIEHLHKQGYNNQEIAKKIGSNISYIGGILHLLKKGEERLIAAVEKGVLSMDLALGIAKSENSDTQIAMLDSYEQGTLSSTQIMKIRRIIVQRQYSGKDYTSLDKKTNERPTPEKLLNIYKAEVHRQKMIIKKTDINEQWLSVIISSLRQLLQDNHFNTLLRAENIQSFPKKLANRIHKEANHG